MLNEPSYGFLKTDKEELAAALEVVRRRICGYNSAGFTDDFSQDNRCDCKYGANIDKIISGEQKFSWGSEQTGCPELRSVIYMLLHTED